MRPRLEPAAVRAVFDGVEPLTVGVEEEILLVDPATMAPVPIAEALVEVAQDPRIKLELPASQIELVTDPHPDVAATIDELAALRRTLAAVCAEADVLPVAAAVHPLAPAVAPVSHRSRSEALVQEYGEIAQRQLVGALQVHVAVGSADATLAVYNGLRDHLPEVAALAAASPFHDGRDTGLASVRPLIASQLPRQGVPPALHTWDAFVDDLNWGAASGFVADPGRWWWEVRPHVVHGTLEVRVPDVQPTLRAAAAVVELVHALISHLRAEHLDGQVFATTPTWRIAENRWSALHHGPHGVLADLVSGDPIPAERRLHALLDTIERHASGGRGLDGARELVRRTTADRLRAVGLAGAVPWLAEAFAVVPSSTVTG